MFRISDLHKSGRRKKLGKCITGKIAEKAGFSVNAKTIKGTCVFKKEKSQGDWIEESKGKAR